MPSRKIEQQLAALSTMRSSVNPEIDLALLRKALSDRVSVVVAKAASLVAEWKVDALIPDLCAAFERRFQDGARTDPQCSAKIALVEALVALDYAEAALFLRGLRHIQMEGVWGGEEDMAVALRGVCALALVSTTDLPRREIFRYLVDTLSDTLDSPRAEARARAAPARIEAIRALERMEGEEATLLLRLKARLGDESSAVTGQIFDSLLRLEESAALPFIDSFLRAAHESVRAEAALALGVSRLPAAVDLLLSAWPSAQGENFRQALLRGLSASRQSPAIEFLLSLVRTAPAPDARAAFDALALHRSDPELRQRIAAARASRTPPSEAPEDF